MPPALAITAPTEVVEAGGIRFAYRRFGTPGLRTGSSGPLHWPVCIRP